VAQSSDSCGGYGSYPHFARIDFRLGSALAFARLIAFNFLRCLRFKIAARRLFHSDMISRLSSESDPKHTLLSVMLLMLVSLELVSEDDVDESRSLDSLSVW